MARTKREPEGYERVIAALAHSPMRTRRAGETLPESSWEHWGVALPKMDAAIRRPSLTSTGGLARSRREAVARASVGSQDRRRADARAQRRRARRRRLGVRHAAHGRSRRLGGRRQSRRRRRALPRRRSGAARHRRRAGSRARICGRAARRWSSPCRGPRTGAIPRACSAGRRASPRSPMVHPESDRLVAARTVQARSSSGCAASSTNRARR